MDDNFTQLNQKLDALLSKAEGTDQRVDSLLVHMDEEFETVGMRFDALEAHIDESIDELATAVKQGFDAVDDRFDAIDNRLDKMDDRFDAMDTRFDAMDTRFDAMDTRFGKMDCRFDALEKTVENMAVATKESFDDMDDRFVELRTEMRDGFVQLNERSNRLDTDVTACTRRINRLETFVGI